MRAAQFVGMLSKDELAKARSILGLTLLGRDYLPKGADLEGYAETINCRLSDTARQEIVGVIAPRLQNKGNADVEVIVTGWIGPHTDEVPFDYTVGLVIEGDHQLYTGSGRFVCDLKPGTAYWLNNKKMHGAMRIDNYHRTK